MIVANTLYVMTPGSRLSLDHDAVRVDRDEEPLHRFPLTGIGRIVVTGAVLVSTGLIERCGEDRRLIVWLDRHGRFKSRLAGSVEGGVLLRLAHHEAARNGERTVSIARAIVAGKIANSSALLRRAARDCDPSHQHAVKTGADELAMSAIDTDQVTALDALRGHEGVAARRYFSAFHLLLPADQSTLAPVGRTRRPPRDPTNALLGYLYTLLRVECISALEAAGLDPDLGFLHAVRPGRPSLALDLMEEFRAPVADRVALTLLRRRELTPSDFETRPGGAVSMVDDARRKVVAAYHERRDTRVEHELSAEPVTLAVAIHLQALLLARTIRGDLDVYPPFMWRA